MTKDLEVATPLTANQGLDLILFTKMTLRPQEGLLFDLGRDINTSLSQCTRSSAG